MHWPCAGPTVLRRLLATDEHGTFRFAQGVLSAWVFGLRVATATVSALSAAWADPDDVGLPLSRLASGIQDLGTLRCLVEGLALLFDYVPRVTCAHASALADLLCRLLAKLGAHPACTTSMLDSAASGVLHAFRMRGCIFGARLLVTGEVERVCLSVLAANDLSRLVESHGPGQAHLYRLLARTRPISDVMRAVNGCPADSLPFGLGLVVQEACLGLSPLLGVLDTAEPSELSPNALAALQAQVSALRCWRNPPSSDSCRAVGEHLCAAWRVHTSPIESRFLRVVRSLWLKLPRLLKLP